MKTTIFSQVSIDGKLTLGAGNSSKDLFELFNPEDIEYIHKFRGKVDGIMVGRKTVETDNPFLTNRFEENKNPVRIVPTSTMDIPLDSNILTDNEKTIIVTTEQAGIEEKIEAIKRKNKDCIICGKDKVDFQQLFERLEIDFDIKSVMVEGGGQLNWSVLDKVSPDEIILMQLPIIIGGATNPTLVDGDGYTQLAMTKKFKLEEIQIKQNYTLMRYKKLAV